MARLTKYANLGGNSGVDKTKSERGKLTVKFKDGSRYVYTRTSAGAYSLKRMRALAQRGRGLNAYINTSVGTGYASTTYVKKKKR